MSEARAITNFIGNTVATLVISKWEGAFDASKAGEILAGRQPSPPEHELAKEEIGTRE